MSGEVEHGISSEGTERTMSMNVSHGLFVTRACCSVLGIFSADVTVDVDACGFRAPSNEGRPLALGVGRGRL